MVEPAGFNFPKTPIKFLKGYKTMHRLGSDPHYAREMVLDDILRSRADLMAHMAEDYLQGTVLGDRQRWAMEKNARYIEVECKSLMENSSVLSDDSQPDTDRAPYRCLKRLAESVKEVAKVGVVDNVQKIAMQEDVDFITEILEDENDDDTICIENCLNVLLLRLIAVF